MAAYEGTRKGDNVVVTVNGSPLPSRNDLRNHSPDGFSRGYAGSGPAQLALALLAHHFSLTDTQVLADLKALALYQTFKERLIASLPEEGWQLSSFVIADTVQLLVKDEALSMLSPVQHTSLSVGDHLIDETGTCHAVMPVGFRKTGNETQLTRTELALHLLALGLEQTTGWDELFEQDPARLCAAIVVRLRNDPGCVVRYALKPYPILAPFPFETGV